MKFIHYFQSILTKIKTLQESEKVEIFGITITVGSYDRMIKRFIESSDKKESMCVLFMNSHMIYEYHNDVRFKNIVEAAECICPDGVPLLYSIKILKNTWSERIAGNDMISSLIDHAETKSKNIFIYGSTILVLRKIEEKITAIYPNLNFKMYSPPFRELTELELDEHAQMINDFGAHIVLVGLGCPKQEMWMYQMKNKVHAPMFGLGGAFLLFAGIDRRAPKWMRKFGLEWAYRLALEPKRLFKRYLITNSYFCWLFVKEFIKIKVFKQ